MRHVAYDIAVVVGIVIIVCSPQSLVGLAVILAAVYFGRDY